MAKRKGEGLIIKVPTCEGIVDGKKCEGTCKRDLPLRCYRVRSGISSNVCKECSDGRYKRRATDKYYFGDEWDF